ncbi:MAG: response regulator [Thiovulaceae bacterium]|nr:response regulator [Sulfurimonadaceae bacterium]
MTFGLRSRLALISFIPILIIVAIASFYVYRSFVVHQDAVKVEEKIQLNILLNDIITELARERGMTSIYLGSRGKKLKNSLLSQRKVVDKHIGKYQSYIKEHMSEEHEAATCETCTSARNTFSHLSQIHKVRQQVNTRKVNFDNVFNNFYTNIGHILLVDISKISHYNLENDITALVDAYLTLAHAKEFSSAERDYIGYILARKARFQVKDFNKWVHMLGKADAISYTQLEGTDSFTALERLFKDEDTVELMEDITSARTSVTVSASDGIYNIEANEWFEMLSEKVRVLDEAEGILLNTIIKKTQISESEQETVFFIALFIWIFALAVAIIARILSNDLLSNIRNLEKLLKHAAQSTNRDASHIQLDSTHGTNQAYKLLDSMIQQSIDDRESAMQASDAKSMFLANMSHEIRTPLNGVVGFTDLLKDTNLDDEQKEFIDIIQKSSENLLEIINNILDLSKIESNKIDIEQIAFNAIEEFESAVEVYSVKAGEKHINLATFIDPSLEKPLKGDPTKIKEVLINLLSNAVKFTNNGGDITVDIRKIESKNGFTKVRFQVQDSGIGVTAEQKSNIFEAFSQADTSITRKYGGTGLGLTISSNFIELMGGKLDLESEPGQGTMFFFTLDLEEVDTLIESNYQKFKNIQALIFSNPNKEKKQEEFLKDYLDYFGVQYESFSSVAELLKLRNSGDYPLTFIDYDYTDNTILEKCVQAGSQTVVIAKSYFMKEIDTLGLSLLKVIYEPITSNKTFIALEKIQELHQGKPVKKETPFDINTSKFNADVLVAEDNQINQKLIKRTLEELGLRITLANNGLEAFEKRKNNDFDLIFMDIQMPILDGTEATEEILEYEKEHHATHVPIVALTANALKGDRERFLAVGMDEYTTKPLVRDDIISILKQFIGHTITKDGADEELIEEQSELETQEEVEQEVIAESPSTKKVLIAKKTTLENRILSDMARKLGLEVVNASSVEELKSLLETQTIDMVLFDKEIPGLDVKDISDTIRASTNSHAVIILMHDATLGSNDEDHFYVHDMISQRLNKDSFNAMIEKHL